MCLLGQSMEVLMLRCGDIPVAHRNIAQGFGFHPTDIILHVGTNDMDIGTPQGVADDLCKLAEAAVRKYGCDVHVSQLTSRNDRFSKEALRANELIEAQSQLLEGVQLIKHPHLSPRHVYDDKHLDRYRCGQDELSATQIFSIDLFKGVYGMAPPTQIVKSSRRWFNPKA